MSTTTKPKHIGRNISRIRELRGMKQEALAIAIGVSQQTVSNMENSETIEDEKLLEVAKALGVNEEVLKNFSEEAVFNIIGNTVNNHDNGALFNYQPNFNPIEKLVEVFEENKKLYERLLQAEKEKVEYLEKLFKNK
ncbi:helix-turn-helix transcriptional regulator [uncultured Flavobacterium sp.]|uniref:helix-turn-helix domain-containing protein n=1 Tax=uncultured Flavobacterium sp. TaxID=165435 RepID=UPI0030ECAE9D|tara:strand:+ start:377 stop:787 length:411 start_codon:yes stop_codon:yes gene_type:complete